MTFPNTTKRRRLVFWLIMLVAGFVAGIVFINFEAVVGGRNPFTAQMDRIATNDVSSFGIIVGVLGAIVIAYVIFGAWALLSILIFFLLSWFDDDLWPYAKQMVITFNEYSNMEAEHSAIDIASRAVIFAWISGFLGFIALAIYFGIG